MWGESCAGRSPQCGAGPAQPMGSADGGARGGGAGRGAISGGAAHRSLSAAERSGEAPARSRRPAGARSEGGRGGSKGGRQRPALGPGLREPETAAAAAAGGAQGTPPLPAPGLRPPLLPRGLARSRLREGERWLGASPGRRPTRRAPSASSAREGPGKGMASA